MRSTASAFTILLSSAFLAACGGDGPTGPGGNDNGGNPGGSSGVSVKDDPSFTNDIWPSFQRNSCTSSGCHGTGQGGLTMSSANGAYSALVDVASPVTGEVRVIPGNANDSYLVKKLEGRQSAGARMPVGGQMSTTDLTNIKNWINKGAKSN